MATATTSNDNNRNPKTEECSIPIENHEMGSPDLQNSIETPLLSPISRYIAPPPAAPQNERSPQKEIYENVNAEHKRRAKKKATRAVVNLVLQLLALLVTLGGVVCSTSVDKFKGKMFYGFDVWKWFVLLMVILCGKLIIGLVLDVILFFFEWEYSLKNNSLHFYFAQVLQASFLAFSWMTAILVTWVLLFVSTATLNITTSILDLVTPTLLAIDIGLLLWFIKALVIKMLATSFSLNSMLDRIKVSVYDHCLLQTLWGLVSDKELREVEVSCKKLEMIQQEKVCYMTMHRLFDLVLDGGFSGMGGTLLSIVLKGDQKENVGNNIELSSEDEAINRANQIFQHMVRNKADEHKKYIDEADFLGLMSKEQVDIAYPMFEVNENKQITQTAFSKFVVRVYKHRTALFNALRSNSRLLIQLDNHVTAVLVVAIFMLWLILVKVEFRQVLFVFGSTIVASAFIIGDFCKQLLNDFIFVFSTNAFDAGDCCLIDDTQVIIEDTDLVTTTAITMNHEVRYYPNAVLCKKTITNYTRSSGHRGDSVVFTLDINTPEHKIETLKSNIKTYIEETPYYWRPRHHLVLEFDLVKEGRMKATLQFKHNINHYEFTEIKARKTKLIMKLKEILHELSTTASIDTQVGLENCESKNTQAAKEICESNNSN